MGLTLSGGSQAVRFFGGQRQMAVFTLEFSNTTPLPAKIYANEGCAQVPFFEGDEDCETSYRDRGGKYQGQVGVTLPRA